MPVPDYQTLMRPLLAYYGDGQERRISSVRDSLARDFALTPADLEERIPSGRAKTFHNRVGWATTYLYRTGLLERPARSLYRITPRGRQVLEANPDRIDLGVLDQFPEFREFRDARKGVSGPIPPLESPGPPIGTTTPEETMDAAYAALREALKLELLDWIRSQSPQILRAAGLRGPSRDGLWRQSLRSCATTRAFR